MKRAFDLLVSFFGILFFVPMFIIVSVLIKLTSVGPIFYRQLRVGEHNKDFKIFKFRTMRVDSDKFGLLTVGERDPRITRLGFYLRKYKLDELPQLINVLIGQMSFVGPRPEVRKYVDLYSLEQMAVINFKPGITDLASIEFRNENEILLTKDDPNQYYISVIMPEKIKINLRYIESCTVWKDISVIIKTFSVLFK